ncbi:type II toxin-antitoxin system VapC family toxin [Pseudomaricurvus alcaniphilus]|uniref:PIN domain-containing protein n=1 Tax=Pseudomaricurvus alcaniphilus TaxID=1166482 RepID=UPI00140B37FD|nr:type II toxin-antitoxin system VapC family toxin [Pseudomaricurvus alcaniphilus]NHN39824.1 type II toxin-antitoxin system VapC family toxin [Pseudomaricurvus alcaniphilus]
MIAIDTNVLLRYLLDDDVKQSSQAKKLIIGGRPVLITDVVLVEAVWTLMGPRYSVDKPGICAIVRALIGDSSFVFEDSQVIWSSLRAYDESKTVRGKRLDFADALIASKAHYFAQNQGDKLSGFYSFDKATEQLEGAKTLK